MPDSGEQGQNPDERDSQIPDLPQYGQGLGSGFVWDTKGILSPTTTWSTAPDKIEVTFADGTTVPAELVGNDPDSDLAVIVGGRRQQPAQPVEMAEFETRSRWGSWRLPSATPMGWTAR